MINLNIFYIIPYNLKFNLIKNKNNFYFYLFYNNYLFKKFNFHFLFNKNYNIFIFLSKHYYYDFFSWNFFFFKKLIFNNQNFKLIKKKHICILKLNFSNYIYIYYKLLILKKIKKNKFIFFFRNFYFYIFYKIFNLKKINIYTKKGIKINRLFILKKKIK